MASKATSNDEIVWSENGVVTCDDARCSKVGASILRRGGHAVDAAIATNLCLGVVSPTESGIGGGAFMVVHDKTIRNKAKAIAFDMRETAPAAAREHMYLKNPEAQNQGPLSVCVPGELKGLHSAWKMFGRLPWKTLFEDAIKYANDGFEVSPFLVEEMERCKKEIMADPGLRQVYAPKGKLLKPGETCYNKQLAKTLTAIAGHGPEVFYSGWVASNLVRDMKGGILTMKDLENYKVNTQEVLEIDVINRYKILGMPPPSSGTLGLALVTNVLSYYENASALEGPVGLHRVVEALKHMLGMRMNLGDPAFDDNSTYIKNITSPSFTKKIWLKIDDNTTYPPQYYENSWKQIIDGGTSHIGVVDKDRNAVALTSSINDYFGAKLLSPSTGIVMNNQMKDFSTTKEIGRPWYLQQAKSNLIAPGKRPLSSMTPLIILRDGQLVGVIGGSGGTNIIAAVTQVFLNRFVLGMDPLTAVRSPRVFPKLKNKDLEYEDKTMINGQHVEVPIEKRRVLENKDHLLNVLDFHPVSHLIIQTEGWNQKSILAAVSDLRKDGRPAAA